MRRHPFGEVRAKQPQVHHAAKLGFSVRGGYQSGVLAVVTELSIQHRNPG
jgi:hypothetical protein